MEIWKYIEILRRPNKAWFFSRDNTVEKIDALKNISNDGYPSLISSLTSFLKYNNREIREATCETIIHLFKKIDNKKGYYETLKYCGISKSDIDFYETIFSLEQYIELLAISSFNSASIRHFARFSLKQANINFGEFYKQNLENGNQIIGSLTGLAEVEAKQFADTIKVFLGSDKIKVRKTAFLALQKLDIENAYEFALINLSCPYLGLRNVITDFLSVIARQEVLEKARECYKTGGYEIKKSMLKLFSNIGGWIAIPDLMIGSIDENENIRQLAWEYLQIWRSRAARLFTTPKQGEIERARQIFGYAHEIQENKQYFKTNPLGWT